MVGSVLESDVDKTHSSLEIPLAINLNLQGEAGIRLANHQGQRQTSVLLEII